MAPTTSETCVFAGKKVRFLPCLSVCRFRSWWHLSCNHPTPAVLRVKGVEQDRPTSCLESHWRRLARFLSNVHFFWELLTKNIFFLKNCSTRPSFRWRAFGISVCVCMRRVWGVHFVAPLIVFTCTCMLYENGRAGHFFTFHRITSLSFNCTALVMSILSWSMKKGARFGLSCLYPRLLSSLAARSWTLAWCAEAFKRRITELPDPSTAHNMLRILYSPSVNRYLF